MSSSTAPQTMTTSKSSAAIIGPDDGKENGMLDIRTLREKSRNLDLPLISALCNDRYLLKQTKAFVLPKHPVETSTANATASNATAAATVGAATSSKNLSRSTNSSNTSSNRSKYPVSGLSATQISKPPRKSSTSTHRHPSEVKGNAYKINSSISTGASPIKKDQSRASHS